MFVKWLRKINFFPVLYGDYSGTFSACSRVQRVGEEIYTLYMSGASSALLHIKSVLIRFPACATAKLIPSVSQRGLLVVPFQYS